VAETVRPAWRERSELLNYFLFPLSGLLLNASLTGRETEPGILGLEAVGAIALGFLFIFLHGFLWFFTGSRLLGFPSQPGESIRIVARAFHLPGIVAVIVAALFLAAALASNSIPQATMQGVGRLCGIWAVCAVVAAFKRTYSASAGRVTLFVIWFLAILFVAVFLYSTSRRFLGAA
jgi:hypothetical protein